MCSIVGYVGKEHSRAFVLEGLRRLEYRGYDSAGFACINTANKQVSWLKTVGGIQHLIQDVEKTSLDGALAIGHTRWSTHGVVSDKNAHPHIDCHSTIAVVHNGIIENYHALRIELESAGHIFQSDTDSETIAHLLESLLSLHSDRHIAFTELVKRLHGAYAFAAIMQEAPDELFIARKRSPVCIGIGDGEMYVASDMFAFAGLTKKVVFLPDDTFALVRKDAIELYDFAGKTLPVPVQEIDASWSQVEKTGFEHFMLKEIYEQKRVVYDTLHFLRSISPRIWDHCGLTLEQVQNIRSIHMVGCGTSWHAALIARYFFETVLGVKTTVHLASEFRYDTLLYDPHALYIAFSQSGETADTLEAIRLVKSRNMPTIAVTNVASSTMVREADGCILTQAQQEIAVASTKSFTAQLAAMYWFVHRFAVERGVITSGQLSQTEEELQIAAEVLETVLENFKISIVHDLAHFYARFDKFIFLGRHISYAFAQEAALKLKEIAYCFVDCYPAGELKHGPLALIEANVPVFIFSHLDPIIYQKLISNAQAVKSRKGHLFVFAFEGQTELIELADNAIVVPRVAPLLAPMAMTGVMQFLMYHIARVLDRPIDKPRNLAKSVTVE